MDKLTLTGQRFGLWLVLCEDQKHQKGHGTYWLCECECGIVKSVSGAALNRGSTKSCGCARHDGRKKTPMDRGLDLTGQRFGSRVVLGWDKERNDHGNYFWKCRCDCGFESSVTKLGLKRSTICPMCAKIANLSRVTKHGVECNPLYKTWRGIRDRCYKETDPKYLYYGQRGIRMHEPWLNDVRLFVKDIETSIGPRPKPINGQKYSLDRIDNDGHYEPGNLRWATGKEQYWNRNIFLKPRERIKQLEQENQKLRDKLAALKALCPQECSQEIGPRHQRSLFDTTSESYHTYL